MMTATSQVTGVTQDGQMSTLPTLMPMTGAGPGGSGSGADRECRDARRHGLQGGVSRPGRCLGEQQVFRANEAELELAGGGRKWSFASNEDRRYEELKLQEQAGKQVRLPAKVAKDRAKVPNLKGGSLVAMNAVFEAEKALGRRRSPKPH